MKKLVVLFFISFLSVYTWSQNPNPNTAVSNYIMDEMEAENIPGATTVIVKNGQIVWLESFGMADIANNKAVMENTTFMLASISKLFTGTALMTLVDDGVIDLDEPINNYLPFPIDVPNHANTDITFRMLMTHTASIEDNGNVMDNYYSTGDPELSLATIMQRYFDVNGSDYHAVNNFHNRQAGTFYDYSNIGTALAGYMVEVVSGMPFDEYCETHIFEPLAMNHTSWFLEGLNINQVAVPYSWQGGQFVAHEQYGFADYPSGQLRMNILDLAKFMNTFLQDGTLNGSEIVSSQAVQEMLSLQVPNLDGTQGLNWYQEDIFLSGGGSVALWGHNGGETGVSTDMYINPDNDIGVAILTNGEGDNLNMIDELYDYGLTLTALPVKLTSFTVQSIYEKVQLTWKTEAEWNSKGYDIEQATDDQNWQKIGFVESKPQSRNTKTYQFLDESPYSGRNYYRLKQINRDGTVEYSDVQILDVWSDTSEWSIFPNPVKGKQVSLFVKDEDFVSGQCSIFDLTGRLVLRKTINHQSTTISTNELATGVYSIMLNHEGQQSWQKLIIQ